MWGRNLLRWTCGSYLTRSLLEFQPVPTIADNKTSDGTGVGSFISLLTGLTAGGFYYIRAYATNSVGTTYGSEISFTTKKQVTDFEGNVYHTITIGSQVWMVENLKTKKYSNGDPIPNVVGSTAWTNLKSGAYCDYDNNASNSAVYGRLYNWYAVNDSRNIAPAGWHVPISTEWLGLEYFLGGQNGGAFFGITINTNFWGATEIGVNDVWSRTLTSDSNIFFVSSGDKASGFSIRCVMN